MNKNSPNTYSDLPGAVGIQRLPPSHPVIDDSLVRWHLHFLPPSMVYTGGRLDRRGRHRHLTGQPQQPFLLSRGLVHGREGVRQRPTITLGFPTQLPAAISPYLSVPSSGMSHLSPPFLRAGARPCLCPCLGSRSTYRSGFSRTSSLHPEKKSKQVHLARDMVHLPTWKDRHREGRPSTPLRIPPCPSSLHATFRAQGREWVGCGCGVSAPGADGGARCLGSLLGWEGRRGMDPYFADSTIE